MGYTKQHYLQKVITLLIETWYYQLGTIPEAIAIVAIGTALIREKFTWSQIFMAGLLIGIFD